MKEKHTKEYKYFDLPVKKWTLFDCVKLTFKTAPVALTVSFLVGLLTALVPSLSIFTTASFVDTAIAILSGSLDKNEIFVPLAGMFLIAIVPQLLYTINFYVQNSMYPKVCYVIDEAFLRKRAKLKYEYIENSDTHDLIGRAAGNSGGTMLNRTYNMFWFAEMIVQMVSIIAIVFVKVWWSGIVTVVVMIPAVLFAVKSGLDQYKAFSDTEKLDRKSNVYHCVLRQKDYLEERSTFRYSPYVIGRWHHYKKEADAINLKTAVRTGMRSNVTWILTWLMGLAIMLSLVPAVATGLLSSGMFVGITNATISLVNMVSGNITWCVRWIVQAVKNLKDLTDFTALSETDGADAVPAVLKGEGFKTIEFKNVTFRYPETERDILKGCSFTMHAGEHYAFVGVNGAGKTTITKLLMGLYDNYKGEILIDGRELREYPLAEKKALFSVVYQDFAKYQIEFEHNVKLGDVNKNDDNRMMDAVQDIGLDDALEKLHSGVHTPLGKISENGVDLSGGEWQRLAIARSLYSDAPMKILDEPTAALDPIAESGIYEMFRRVTVGHSAIFITHRLGGARIADKIIVLDRGRVAEFGSHDELISMGGIYAEMFNTQKGWYED